MALEEKLTLEVYFQIEELNAENARLRAQLATAKKALECVVENGSGNFNTPASWKIADNALKELGADE